MRCYCLSLVIYLYISQTLFFLRWMQSLVHKVLRTIIEDRRSLWYLTSKHYIVWFSIYLCSIIHFNSHLLRQLLLLKITSTFLHWVISRNLSQLLLFFNHWHQCILSNRFIYNDLSATPTDTIHALSQIKCLPPSLVIIDTTVSFVDIKYIRFPGRRLFIHHLLLLSLRRCHAAVIADIL